ncbi:MULTISPECIES: YoaK family protein [unclassified Actinotalea]|uniref:YoaK family protein n=1 Tax=unclassified Actinotalea TaxID=2638618 RepID=UPI0015F5CD47|nr:MULTISPECIES: YoaK family protein [unclassified Actinotalea]
MGPPERARDAATARAADPRARALATTGLLLLTASTGLIDAVSYLSLDRVFTGNMTGNVLFLGFALAGVEEIPFLNNAVALAGFVLGSIVGGRVVPRGRAEVLPAASLWTLVVGTGLAAVLCGVWFAVGDLGTPMMLVITALLAALMGAQVAAAKPVGNADITTVVVTSTLANLARDSRLAGAPRGANAGWLDRFLAVAAMGVGAAVGAAVIRAADGQAALAVGVALILTATGVLLLLRRHQVADARASTPSVDAA